MTSESPTPESSLTSHGKALRTIALVDGSHYSESVCDHAAWIAHRTPSTVELVHLISSKSLGGEPANLSGSIGLGARTALLAELAELDAQKARLAQHRGRAILVDAESRLADGGIGNVRAKLRHGEVVESLQELEQEADLIVMGKRGEASDPDSPMLGDNLERAIRATRKPLLVASRAFSEPQRFLLAFDGGKSALKAVEYIARGRQFNDLECHMVSVGPPDISRQRQLEGAATLLAEAGYSVDTTHVVNGQAEAVIVAEAEQRHIDLVIMGAYGHSRIRNLIIGSTTSQVVRQCRLPILLFR